MFRWCECSRYAEWGMLNLWRPARSRACGSIVGPCGLCARACGTFCVHAYAHCVVRIVSIYYVAINALMGSMEKPGEFAATLQRARPTPVWSRTCGNVPCLAREAGWIHSGTRQAYSGRVRGCEYCYGAACTRAGMCMNSIIVRLWTRGASRRRSEAASCITPHLLLGAWLAGLRWREEWRGARKGYT